MTSKSISGEDPGGHIEDPVHSTYGHGQQARQPALTQEADQRSERPSSSNTLPFKNNSKFEESVALWDGISESEMLGEHPSYHQAITGKEARRRLEQNGGHCYLTRYSKANKCYVLSVYEHQYPPSLPSVEHFEIKVITNTGKLGLRNKTQIFDNIDTLLQYYRCNRISPALRSIGEAYAEKEYKRVEQEEAEERERQEQARRELAERERQEQAERERQERERQGQVDRQRLRRERQEHDQEERDRQEREREEREKRCIIL